jgi:hypothetical protein
MTPSFLETRREIRDPIAVQKKLQATRVPFGRARADTSEMAAELAKNG